MKPSKIEFDLGHNCFKQPVRLIHQRTSDGGYSWTLHRGQIDMRDDSAEISGLTDEQLLALADAVKSLRAAGG